MNDTATAPRRDRGTAKRPPIPTGAAPMTAMPGTESAKPGAAAASPWVFSTYFAEGLPWSIAHQVSAEMFTALGSSLQAVGLTSLYGITWNAKALWSPVVEMFGTTRRWIIGTELALVIAFGAVAWFAGFASKDNLAPLAIALAAVAFLGATQDIAIDGSYMKALAKEQQTSLSGLRVGAYRVALIVGKGGLVLIAGFLSWRACFLAAAGILLALAVLHAVLLPREERRSKSGGGSSFAKAFKTFFAQPKIAWSVAFIVLFRAGDALMFAMSAPLLQSLGLDTTARATLSGIIGTPTSIAGSILGGVIIARFSLARTIRPITVIQSLAILLYVWLAWATPGWLGIAVIIVVEQFVAGIGTAALMVFLMRRAVGEHRTSHFAIGSSLMSVGATVLGSVSGYLAHAFGYPIFFALAFAASVPGVFLSFKVPTE